MNRRPLPASRLFSLLLVGLIVACGRGNAQGADGSGAKGDAGDADRVRVEVTTATEYYAVHGSATAEIFAFMENYGPVDDKGQRAQGVTHYSSRLDWRPDGRARACGISSMTIRLEMRVVLPALDGLARLPADLQSKWTKFGQGVADHEQRHVDIYTQAAEQTRQLMLAIQPERDCGALEAGVDGVWSSQQQAIEKAQERFHEEDRARIDALRAPIKAQIDDAKARLASLTAQIAVLDANIKELSGRISAMKTALDSLRAQMKAIEDRYPDQQAPGDVFQQYEALRAEFNRQVQDYNALVEQYNRKASERAGLAAQAEALRGQTNALVDQFNWTS